MKLANISTFTKKLIMSMKVIHQFVYITIKHLKRIMSSQTKIICEWLITNRLTINAKKTKYMILHRRRDPKFLKKVKKFRLNVNNYCIKQVSEFKYLGVLLDNKLNWHKHIETLCSKVSKASGVLYRLKKLSKKCKKVVIPQPH